MAATSQTALGEDDAPAPRPVLAQRLLLTVPPPTALSPNGNLPPTPPRSPPPPDPHTPVGHVTVVDSCGPGDAAAPASVSPGAAIPAAFGPTGSDLTPCTSPLSPMPASTPASSSFAVPADSSQPSVLAGPRPASAPVGEAMQRIPCPPPPCMHADPTSYTVRAPHGADSYIAMQPPCMDQAEQSGMLAAAQHPLVQPQLQEFLAIVQRPAAPILPTPSTRRRRSALPPNFTPRRSNRIAKADRGLDSEAKAKRVLLKRLGIISDDEAVSEEALEQYNKLFEHPLADDIVQAFADFYGWHVPSNLATLLAEPPLPPQSRLVEV